MSRTKRPDVEITLKVTLTYAEQLQLLQNSVERVLNNAIAVGSAVQDAAVVDSHIRERGSTLWQDAEELLPVVRKLWWEAANQVRVEAMKSKEGV